MAALSVSKYPTEGIGCEKDRRTNLTLLAGDKRRLTLDSMNPLKFSMKLHPENDLRKAFRYCRIGKNNYRLQDD
ncbi:hypothetical protein [Labrenzia sp. OB1]|uniref:hypothetical protein n=1 Tax=Labrenzia sp. OB1 TaxID=1561204 RepID=UPI0007B29274|nr:hypothetical protein [Labrenzia sp. OB1]KZM48989.1 hypothetical protein OA90_17530 [Labrenzia sp. OB1]